MSKCLQCNIEILDETEHCPLCHSVLEKADDVENMYPDARVMTQKLSMLLKIYSFAFIVAELVLANVVLFAHQSYMIAVIPALILAYGYVIIRYAIIGRTSYVYKALLLTLLAVLVLIGIDYITENSHRGWSVNYVLPSGILFIDLGIFVLILVNRKNWQSYISTEIVMLLCCGATWILYLVNVITQNIMLIISTNVTLVLFIGTIVIGGRRARIELYRRFHIK